MRRGLAHRTSLCRGAWLCDAPKSRFFLPPDTLTLRVASFGTVIAQGA
ncbi:hypothetical protein PAMC26577_31960 [Caballeronia sordidicola]|uniref:Uncharacterized protein n=1 Tax=Caballeronia sordidicola TaxID=196367 RepID=A0A242MCE0_CABSO|nr:hypothetical protein PAMC26577_31960 [Caballeronia sordidicola]